MNALLWFVLLQMLAATGASDSSIIGGKKAPPHARPYMASVQIRGAHICGGFLIREDFVLTAGHCYNYNESMTVVLGTNDIKGREKTRQEIKVKKQLRHAINTKDLYDFDIMLLKLKTNATLNKAVKVIKLAQKGETVKEGQECLMSGWGKRKPNSDAERFLQDVTLTLQRSQQCRRIWQRNFVPSRMLCTEFNGKKGICQGDSGGPLICQNRAHGLASMTATPCDQKLPNIFTKISSHIPWIEETMNK